MLTLKQIETFVRIVELGTFERAAQRLNTTPSTVSKRIAELEDATGLVLFDRSRKRAQLTDEGERLLEHALATLNQTQQILALNQQPARLHRLRMGLTELAALTWLPDFLQTFTKERPDIRLDINIDMSRTLHQQLQDGDLDLVVIPAASDVLVQPGIEARLVGEVDMAFMARKGLVEQRRSQTLQRLENYPLIGQGKRSGYAQHVDRWLNRQGMAGATLTADNLLAMVGLVTAGQGISVLPYRCVTHLAQGEEIEVIDTVPALPPINYFALYHEGSRLRLLEAMAARLAEAADFTRPFFV